MCVGGGGGVMGALWLMIWESSKGLSREGFLQQKMVLELMTKWVPEGPSVPERSAG